MAKKKTKRSVKKKTTKKTKKAAKKTSKKKSSKKKTTKKKTKKAAPIKRQEKTEEIRATYAPPVPSSTVDKATAWISLALNVLIAPGLGTLLIKEFASAVIQLLLVLIAVIWLWATGEWNTFWIILGISAFWAITNSIHAIRSAR